MNKANKIVALLIGLSSLLASCTKGGSDVTTWSNYSVIEHEITYFENPVYSNGADPSIIRDKQSGLFYAYPTSSSFGYEGETPTPKVGPILESSDLVHWVYKGSVFDKVPSWGRKLVGEDEYIPASGMGVWAPDIVYLNNQYYYYYTLGTMAESELMSCGIGVCTSDTPYGPWVDHGKLFDGYDVSHRCCIDPCVRQDDDGRIYCFYGSFKGPIDVVELDETGLAPKNKNPEERFGKFTKFGLPTGDLYEGTYIAKMFGKYYFFASGGTCCKGLDSNYFTVSFMSDSLMGTYYDDKGVDAYHSNDSGCIVIEPLGGYAKGTGHVSVIEDDAGDFFLVYHAYDSLNNNGVRKLMIDKLIFDEKGFPHVKNQTSSLGGRGEAPYIITK